MVYSSVHEYYYEPSPTTPRALRKIGRSQAGADSSLSFAADDVEEHFKSVQSARLSASERLRSALKTQIEAHPAQTADGGQARTRTLWTVDDPEEIGSVMRAGPLSLYCAGQRPMSQHSPRSIPLVCEALGDTFQKVVIRDNTARANEWITECTPKVSQADNQKEVWVQIREAQRKQLRSRNQALQKMRRNAMPFDEWLHMAKQAEQVADEEEFVEEHVVSPEAIKLIEKMVQIQKGQAEEKADRRAKVTFRENVTLHDLRIFLEDLGKPDWQKCYHKLAEEFTTDKCDLTWNCDGVIERIVHVANIHLETRDGGLFLVQLGNWSQGKVHPTCLLPGAKQTRGELAGDAIQRLLKQEFSAFGTHVRLGNCQAQTHWRKSPAYGVRTKYVSTVVEGKLEVAVESVHLTKTTPKGMTATNLMDSSTATETTNPRNAWHGRGPRQSRSSNSHRDQHQRPSTHHCQRHSRPGHRPGLPALATARLSLASTPVPDIYMLWHGDEIELLAWLRHAEFEDLRSLAGERLLHFWLSSVIVDPTQMPPKPNFSSR